MKKVHTRQKKKLGISTHLRGTKKLGKRSDKPKAFKSEEKAKTYLKNKNLELNYEIYKLKENKFKIRKI